MKTKLQQAAEKVTREVLNAYHRRKGDDLTSTHVAVEAFLRRFVADLMNDVRASLDKSES